MFKFSGLLALNLNSFQRIFNFFYNNLIYRCIFQPSSKLQLY